MRVSLGRIAIQGALALLLVLATPFTARAAGEGEIHNYIISISRLYERLDYERALNRVQLARQLPRGTEEEVTLSLYEGIILCEMGNPGPGTSAFESALLLRPDAKLPVMVAPKVEQLFESVRKRVMREMAPPLAQREPENPPKKTEPIREPAPTPPVSGPDRDKLPVGPAHSKASPRPSGPMDATPKGQPDSLAEKREDKALAEQPDCGPEPSSSTVSRSQRDMQLWRLARMKHELCSSGRFQGFAAKQWTDLKTRMEDATTSLERMRISQDIDQFAREFLGESLRRNVLEVSRREEEAAAAERREAEREEEERARLKKSQADANLDTSRCQPAVSADCERLMQRLLFLQQAFLQTKPRSKLPPIKELVKIGQKLRASRTSEELQEAEQSLDSWKQQHLPQE